MSVRLLNRSTRRRPLIFLFLLAGLLAGDGGVRPAQAQQADVAETDATIQVETKPGKSPTRAQLYSLGGTLVPVVFGAAMDKERDDVRVPLWIAGTLVGPSVGHFYAENISQALTGMGLRLGGGALGVLGGAAVLDAALGGDSSGEGGAALFLAGGLTILISGGYDIFTADDAARDYNEAHGLKAHAGPAVGPQGEQLGLSLKVQF